MPKFYTVKQVADALDFSTNTVYKHLEEGGIKATRIGKEGRFRISEKEVLRLMAMKGENAQIAPAFADAPLQTLPDSQPEVIPTEEVSEKLAILNKVAIFDLFDWFLSLSAIFTAVAYFLFPNNFELRSFEPFRGVLFSSKLILFFSGIGLIGVDLFVSPRKGIYQLLVKALMIVSFWCLAAIYYLTGEYLSFGYFVVLFCLSFLTIIWKRHSYLKFILLSYSTIALSGLIYSYNPFTLAVGDVSDFVLHNPEVFRVLLLFISTSFCGLALWGYFRAKAILYFVSGVIALIMLLTSVNFMADQSWNKVVISVLISSFALATPFYQRLESFTRISRREMIISFSSLVVILFVGLIIVYYIQSSLRSLILKTASQRIEAAVRLIENYLDDSNKTVQSFSQNPDLVSLFEGNLAGSSPPTDKLSKLIKDLYLSSTTFRKVALFDTVGKALVGYPTDYNFSSSNLDISSEEFFKAARDQKQVILSQAEITEDTPGGIGIYSVAPIIDSEGGFKGAVVSSLDMPKLLSKLSILRLGDSEYFILADRHKKIFSHPNPKLIGKEASLNKNLIAAVEGESGENEGYSEEGILTLQSYAPIKLAGWGLITQQPYSKAFRQSSFVAFTVFLATLLVGVGTLLVMTYLKREKGEGGYE